MTTTIGRLCSKNSKMVLSNRIFGVVSVCLCEGIDCQVGGYSFCEKKKYHRAHGVMKFKNVCESPSKKEQQKETTEQVTKSANKRQMYMNPRIFECAHARTPR